MHYQDHIPKWTWKQQNWGPLGNLSNNIKNFDSQDPYLKDTHTYSYTMSSIGNKGRDIYSS